MAEPPSLFDPLASRASVTMSSTLPAVPTARSVLEDMLATLKTREEKPKDLPPALPSRPTLKRRPRSSKMPAKFKVEEAEAEPESKRKASETSEELKELHSDLSETDGSKLETQSDEGSTISEEICVSQPSAETVPSKDVPDPRLEEFEKLISNISDELKRKEEENATLLQQLQQFEKQWTLCQEQMKCMEDVYLQQIEALKTSLASAQMTLAAVEAAAKQQARLDSEASATGPAPAPAPAQAPTKPHVSAELPGDQEDPVRHLVEEFEKQKQAFEHDARVLEVAKRSAKNRQSVASSMEELRELKARYNSWRKEYEVRLHHAKKSLLRLLKPECEKQKERWWFSRRKRNNKTTPQTNRVGFCH